METIPSTPKKVYVKPVANNLADWLRANGVGHHWVDKRTHDYRTKIDVLLAPRAISVEAFMEKLRKIEGVTKVKMHKALRNSDRFYIGPEYYDCIVFRTVNTPAQTEVKI